jgi:hypothetical protein
MSTKVTRQLAASAAANFEPVHRLHPRITNMNSLARLSKLSVTFAKRTPVSRAMISGSAKAAGGAKHDNHGHDNHGHDDHHDDHAHHDHPVTMLVISLLLFFFCLFNYVRF